MNKKKFNHSKWTGNANRDYRVNGVSEQWASFIFPSGGRTRVQCVVVLNDLWVRVVFFLSVSSRTNLEVATSHPNHFKWVCVMITEKKCRKINSSVVIIILPVPFCPDVPGWTDGRMDAGPGLLLFLHLHVPRRRIFYAISWCFSDLSLKRGSNFFVQLFRTRVFDVEECVQACTRQMVERNSRVLRLSWVRNLHAPGCRILCSCSEEFLHCYITEAHGCCLDMKAHWKEFPRGYGLCRWEEIPCFWYNCKLMWQTASSHGSKKIYNMLRSDLLGKDGLVRKKKNTPRLRRHIPIKLTVCHHSPNSVVRRH